VTWSLRTCCVPGRSVWRSQTLVWHERRDLSRRTPTTCQRAG